MNNLEEENKMLRKHIEQYRKEQTKLIEDKLEYLGTLGRLTHARDKFKRYLEDTVKHELDELDYFCKEYNIPTKNNGSYIFVRNFIRKLETVLETYKDMMGGDDKC